MSRIYGMLCADGESILDAALEKMRRACYFAESTRCDEWSGDEVSLGHLRNPAINLEPQPFFDAAGEKVLIFAGHLLDSGALREELEGKGHVFVHPDNDAELMLHFLSEFGVSRLERLNGIFTAALWNGREKNLTLINDRYGICPLFYSESPAGGAFVFSSELKSVIRSGVVEAKANWRTWNVFLRCDHVIGDDTFFEGVRRLPPASVLTFSSDKGIAIRAYWGLSELGIEEGGDLGSTIDRTHALYSQAVGKSLSRVTRKLWIPLTGGHDTRWLAAELARRGTPFTAFTTRKFSQYPDDIEIARAVAAELGLDHRVVEMPGDFIARYERIKNSLTDYETDEQHYLYPMAEAVPSDCTVCFDGTGDLVINGIFADEGLRARVTGGKLRTVAAAIVRKRGMGLFRRLNDGLLKGGAHRDLMGEGAAIDLVEDEMGKQRDCDDPITAFYIFNRMRRELSLTLSHVYIGKSETFPPYLENDFFDYAMSLPPSVKRERRVLHGVLERHYPRINRIPYTHFMGDEEQKRYFDDSVALEEQLKSYCADALERLHRGTKNWLSPRFFGYAKLLFEAESRLGLVHRGANALLPHSVRKYPFPRYLASFSVIRMLAMLGDWIDEYGIEIG